MKNKILVLITLTLITSNLTMADVDPGARERISKIEEVIRTNKIDGVVDADNSNSLAIGFGYETELMLIDLNGDLSAEFVKFEFKRDKSYSLKGQTIQPISCTIKVYGSDNGNVGQWELVYEEKNYETAILIFFCEDTEAEGEKSLPTPVAITNEAIVKMKHLDFQFSKIEKNN